MVTGGYAFPPGGGASLPVPSQLLACRPTKGIYSGDLPSRMLPLPRPESFQLPPVNQYYRNTAFTRQFIAGPTCSDGSLEKAFQMKDYGKHLIEKRKAKVEKSRKSLETMSSIHEKQSKRLEELRKKIREERRQRYELILRAVLRLQSIYRRKRLAEEKARKEKEARKLHAIKRIQGWIRNRQVVSLATNWLLQLKEDVSRRRAERTIGYFILGRRRVYEAQQLRMRLMQEKAIRRMMAEQAALEKIARFLQARFRGRRARARSKKIRERAIRAERGERGERGEEERRRPPVQEAMGATAGKKRMKRTGRRRSKV